jgi:ABC-type lipoprotein release transport system permease subunit
LLLRIALRNIWLHRLRTLIVGGILAFGTALLIVGNGLVDAIEGGMERSIVRSIAGHLQVYSADAEDELALFGRPGMVESHMGKIPNFRTVKDALLTLPNVARVVPMGVSHAVVFGGNSLDLKCAELRERLRAGEPLREVDWLHLRTMVEVLEKDLETVSKIAQLSPDDIKRKERLKVVMTEAFWQACPGDPAAALEEIENHVAPLGARADMFFIMYLGTDPQAYAEAFELFEVVEGQNIPAGQRGFLLNKRFYERHMKNRVAFNLDTVKMLRDDEDQLIADESDLREKLAQNVRQAGTLMMDLDPDEARELRQALLTELSRDEGELEELLKSLLDMNDANFDRRVAFFYREVAPRIILFRFKVGDSIPITSMTRSRSAKTVKLKIWGVFQFSSLEKSLLAGNHNIMDLVTFRQLYGFATEAEKVEMNDLIGVRETGEASTPDEADTLQRESDLFGDGDDAPVAPSSAAGFDEFADHDLKATRASLAHDLNRSYSHDELEEGIAINAAVILHDATKLTETQNAIEALSEAKGLNLKTATWHEASGMIGNFTSVIRLVLNVAILIIFIVALVIMNNALVMATMERVREVGTIRAMGAQRSFVMGMFLSESLLMTVIFGTLGACLGMGIMTWLNATGIPAAHKILFFLFGGPSLHPTFTMEHVVTAALICGVVSLVSTLYPAWLATRIQPVTAMQTND